MENQCLKLWKTGKAQTAEEAGKLCKKLWKPGKCIFLWRKTGKRPPKNHREVIHPKRMGVVNIPVYGVFFN